MSHRQELVNQPRKYFKSSYGIELNKNKSNDERIISASIQTIVKRLNNFNQNDFEIIIVDEAHHTPAPTYQKILNYFKPKFVFGFTATPSRGDKIGLEKYYDEIIFCKDLVSGIKDKYLCDIECKRVDIGYSLKDVKKTKGDFVIKQLDEAVNIEEANKAVVEAYNKYAIGQTIIFCVSVAHCYELQKLIPESKVIDGKTKPEERQNIINDFTTRKFKCLINCMVFTEGTDIPLIETAIIARPTQNSSLYTQMVGRGLRLYPGKDKLILIDCVGASSLDICTAPTLIGLNMDNIPKKKESEIEGNLFDLEGLIEKHSDNPESWIKNTKSIDLWAKRNKYNTHNVNYFRMPNGDLKLNIPGLKPVIFKKPDELGYTLRKGQKVLIQTLFDKMFMYLRDNYQDQSQLWDLQKAKRWGRHQVTSAQVWRIKKEYPDININLWDLTKFEASQILARII